MTTTTSTKIICDSVSPAGHRLTTFECTFPRIILAEVNTHRQFSRNSASSRAIPVEKMVARVLEDPYVPTHWGKNQRGMRADEDVDEVSQSLANNHWLLARDSAVAYTKSLLQDGIHKQITNRLLEPFMWHTALVTATEWSNFFHLRDNKDAHPDFRDLAHAMRELYEKGEPEEIDYGEWHLPLIGPEDYDSAFEQNLQGGDSNELQNLMAKVSVGRCARVSLDKHNDGEPIEKTIARCETMLSAGHMSPFEHVARAMTEHELRLFEQRKFEWRSEAKDWWWDGESYTHFLGNFNGWISYRKLIPHEHDILGAR